MHKLLFISLYFVISSCVLAHISWSPSLVVSEISFHTFCDYLVICLNTLHFTTQLHFITESYEPVPVETGTGELVHWESFTFLDSHTIMYLSLFWISLAIYTIFCDEHVWVFQSIHVIHNIILEEVKVLKLFWVGVSGARYP